MIIRTLCKDEMGSYKKRRTIRAGDIEGNQIKPIVLNHSFRHTTVMIVRQKLLLYHFHSYSSSNSKHCG